MLTSMYNRLPRLLLRVFFLYFSSGFFCVLFLTVLGPSLTSIFSYKINSLTGPLVLFIVVSQFHILVTLLLFPRLSLLIPGVIHDIFYPIYGKKIILFLLFAGTFVQCFFWTGEFLNILVGFIYPPPELGLNLNSIAFAPFNIERNLLNVLALVFGAATIAGIWFAWAQLCEIQSRFYTFEDFNKKAKRILQEGENDIIKILTLSPAPGNISAPESSRELSVILRSINQESQGKCEILFAYLGGDKENNKENNYEEAKRYFDFCENRIKLEDDEKCKEYIWKISSNVKGYLLWNRIYLPFLRAEKEKSLDEIYGAYLDALENVRILNESRLTKKPDIRNLDLESQSEVVIIKNSRRAVVGIPLEYPFPRGHTRVKRELGLRKDFIKKNREEVIETLKSSMDTISPMVHFVGFELTDQFVLTNLDKYISNFFRN